MNEDTIKFILSQHDTDHTCEPNKAKIIADKLRDKMKYGVKCAPAEPVMTIINSVKEEAASMYEGDEFLYNQIIYELGANKPLVKQMLIVREVMIEKTPSNRNHFVVEDFLTKVYRENH